MDIGTEAYNEIYKEIAELIGKENTVKLYRLLKGQQISFPVRLYSKDYVKKRVICEYDGSNSKFLARRYGYSERWIRELIKENV